ncbi:MULTISPECIES: EamA family transporter [Acinetobacter]|uniref:EamA family transporter n=1 Tax=Acinetobacter piscicola TaxID=2006115 RepID=A0A7S7AIQ6_9GAMM|nr:MULTISPECIES: EamA family transporter [Acinetobacter]MDM1756750.1 EamA family transporter [Acinetobacter sp. 256-1]MDM1761940.1 EamA family transporter [Acinetobacter sp. 251-1]QOW47452.1 EamA family transporter [Acinetobacter piscicola]
MQNSQFLAVFYMIMSMVAYQISASFAKQLFQVLDPLTVVTLRLCFASILIFMMFRSWKIIKRLPHLKWKDLLFYSASVCLMNVLFYASLGKLPQGIAVGLEFLGPLTLALLSIQRKIDYIWVVLAMIGIALMVPWQDTQQDHFSYVGAAFALGAGICWAFYIYFGQKVVRQNIGMHALTIAITLSALVMLPISAVHNPTALMQTQYWGQALIIALLATAIPYALDLMALKTLSKLSYGTLSSLSPALAAIAGMVLLKEHISLGQSIALLCIMIASIGVTFKPKSTVIEN